MTGTHRLHKHWRDGLLELLQSARSAVLVSSPFVTCGGIEFLTEHLPSTFRSAGRLSFLTDLSPQNVVQGATDPEALRRLADVATEFRLYHLPRLHAKVYLADTDAAIITSGNLTEGGLRLNYEYGVSIADTLTVSKIRNDTEGYASLGALLKLEQLSAYSAAAETARVAYGGQLRSAHRSARRTFEEAFEHACIELLRLRVAGDSVHAILSKTVLYLLEREAPLSTAELHPLVQALHPDICDDSIERIIDGEHFGKKWKHWVRSAQAMLKRQGRIELRDGRWYLH